MSHTLTRAVAGYTGRHWWYGWLPIQAQARLVARAWLRSMPGVDPATTPLVVRIGAVGFRLLDRQGRLAHERIDA